MFDILKHKIEEEADDGKGGTPTVAELQASLEASQASVKKLEAKQVEILDETKKAKAARTAAEAQAAKELQEAADKSGDHKQMYEAQLAANQALQIDLDNLKSSVSTEKRDGAALSIATQLADGENAELLKPFIASRLKHTDEGLKVLDTAGGVTINSLEDLATEFKNNARYSALLKGNQSTGGGANGGGKGGGAANVMTRADFETLNPIAAAKFTKEGGSVTD